MDIFSQLRPLSFPWCIIERILYTDIDTLILVSRLLSQTYSASQHNPSAKPNHLCSLSFSSGNTYGGHWRIRLDTTWYLCIDIRTFYSWAAYLSLWVSALQKYILWLGLKFLVVPNVHTLFVTMAYRILRQWSHDFASHLFLRGQLPIHRCIVVVSSTRLDCRIIGGGWTERIFSRPPFAEFTCIPTLLQLLLT